MAAGPLVLYDSFAEALGDGTIDLATDTIHVALFTNSYTPSAAHTSFAALTGQVAAGNGYTSGGAALTYAGVTRWGRVGALATFDAADLVFTASGGSIVARYAVLYSVTATGDDLIGYILLDTAPDDVTVTDTNDLTFQWHANGILSVAPVA